MQNELIFNITLTGQIEITRFETWECRGDCALEMLAELVGNWLDLFRSRSGAIWYDDSPPPAEWSSLHELAFCSTKRRNTPSDCLPFPCPMFLRWPEVGIPDAEAMMRDLLADETPFSDERIFWIGAESNPSRRSLFEMGRRYPDRFDVEIIEWDRKAPGGQRSKTRQVSIPDHRRYKYLIDCPGNGYSARIKWLLATGRPLFIVERNVIEHWHEQLEPWVHFIPVAADLSDLQKQHERVEADPALYESIGRNARRFAAENLTVETQLSCTADAVRSATNLKINQNNIHS